MRKIAVIGSRDFPNLVVVSNFVRALSRKDMIVSGGARGVDFVAEEAARFRRISRLIYEPQCEDGAPGYVEALFARNKLIIEAADEVVAFHDGVSRGTAAAIAIAKRLGKPIDIRGSR